MKSASVLEGSAIRLEPLTEAHASERYLSWLNDPVVCRDNRHGSGYTPEKMRDYLRGLASRTDERAYAIIRKADGAHVGNAAINSISAANRSAELSLLIGERSAWGAGLGTEVCRLLAREAFEALGLHRLFIGATRRNEAMIRIAEKIGMKREGVLKDAFFKDGVYHDIVQLSMTRPASAVASIVVLMRYGNLVGLEYLKALGGAGLSIDAVVFEGDSYHPNDRRIVEERTKGKYKPLFLGDVLPGAAALRFVKDHNSPECVRLLAEMSPDVLILGGTAVLKRPVLETARRGALNCHPGLLPDYRGCSCVEWAIWNDDPVAATCHLVTEKIDQGPVIYSEAMPIYAKDDYSDIRTRMIGHQARVLLEGVRRYLAEPARDWPAPGTKGTYRKVMDAATLEKLFRKIEEKKYGHLVNA